MVNEITLCLILEEEYVLGAVVLLRSMHHYNDVQGIPLVVMVPEGFSEASMDSIRREHQNTKFVIINLEAYRDCKFNEHRQWGLTPAARYELFRWNGTGQLLYLDADMLVMGDISALLAYRGPLGACRMPAGEGMELIETGGFNGGLLTLDATFRELETWQSLLSLAEAKPWSGNQTVLNLHFGSNFYELGMQFNMPTTHLTMENFEDVAIAHFVGRKKPWDVDRQFGDHQVKRAGLAVCSRLLREWRRFSE